MNATKASVLSAIALVAVASSPVARADSYLEEYAVANPTGKWVGPVSGLTHTGAQTYRGDWPGVDNSRHPNPRTLRISLDSGNEFSMDELPTNQHWSGKYSKSGNTIWFSGCKDDSNVFACEGHFELPD